MVQIITFISALAFSLASVQAAPTSEHAPSLFSHDPYSIHRRSSSPSLTKRDLEGEVPETCSSECGLIKVKGVKNEREALCSEVGLEATRVCAECIDTAFPHTRFQESAMSEYEKIIASCGASA